MNNATEEILQKFRNIFEERKRKIINSESMHRSDGTVYYVSNSGDDDNDGKTPQTAWKTLERVSKAYLYEGDAVLFKRGDLFRGNIKAKSGVTYSAYGEGDKPKLYGGCKSLADPKLWELYNEEYNIWKCI